MARGVESRGDYKRMMDYADMPRQGDLDGRGNLSRRALAAFTEWFLKVCLDQVGFMSSLFALDTLVDRLKIYVIRREWKAEALLLLEQTLHRGELPRGEAGRITGLQERRARDLLAAPTADGILGSDTPKGRGFATLPVGCSRGPVPRPVPGGMSRWPRINRVPRAASRFGSFAPDRTSTTARAERPAHSCCKLARIIISLMMSS